MGIFVQLHSPFSRPSFLLRLANWQTRRWLWLLSAGIALILNLIAHNIFQLMMGMSPCEKCVYIRYAMFCIVIAGLITAIKPHSMIFRVVGYLGTFYGALFGALWSWQLISAYRVMSKIAKAVDPFAAGLGQINCQGFPHFHFNLPLQNWFPSWFMPSGLCGTDNWSFFGLNMGCWTLIIFIVYLLVASLCFVSLVMTHHRS